MYNTNNSINNTIFRVAAIFHNLKANIRDRYLTLLMLTMCIVLWFVEPVLIIIPTIVWLIIISEYLLSEKCIRKFLNKGLITHGGEVPILKYSIKKGKFITYKFYNPGIPIDEWYEKSKKIAIAFGITIASIEDEDGTIVIKGYNGFYKYSKKIYWEDSMLLDDDRIVVGDNLGRPEVWNLEVHPHALIGGTTGSGKTVVFKSIIHQCMMKNYEVYIVDFKKGVDFSSKWRKDCAFITSKEKVVECLSAIVEELERREYLLAKANCRSLGMYNCINTSNNLSRIIVACDEVGSLLDLTALSADEKQLTVKIYRLITTIARLGRATGINLLLSTQRPDAKILTGDLKSNITYRLSGRADNILSQIILDNTLASEIPKNIPGIFVNQEGNWIKGYLLTEDEDNERENKS